MATHKNGDDYSIFSPEFSTNSLSATGFKSTHYAIAELIDNSVQSALEDKENKKCNIEVIAIDKDQRLSKIIVVDDAGGMDKNVLRYSLGVGKGKHIVKKKNNRRGKGKTSKFGLGLKQASLAQCKRFEVFSWQNENEIYMSYLDKNLMETGKLRLVPEPIKTNIPEEINKIIKLKKSKSGTCVIWYDISEKATWKTSFGLFKNAEIELGRMYRNFIDDKNVNITLTSHDEISKGVFKEKFSRTVRKNDPLFLMKDCVVKDYKEYFKGENQFDYVEKETFQTDKGVEIIIKYSVTTKKFREAAVGSGNKLNTFVGKNDGVSVVRNGRELELEKSFLTKDTRERFIGVEISFDEDCDDIMGVDGKKQSAQNFFKRDIEELATDEGKTEIEYLNSIDSNLSGEEVILIKISNSITSKINTLLKLIRSIRKDTIKKPGSKDSPESEGTTIVNERPTKTKSDEEFKRKTDAQKLEFIKKQLEEAGNENVDENANEIIGKKLRFHFTDVDNLPRQMLFDIELKAGIYNIKLNKQHPAFLDFFKLLADQDSLEEDKPSSERGLKLLLESWARLEDEAPEKLKDELQGIRLQWGVLAMLFFKKKN
jgi:hypothetical protein